MELFTYRSLVTKEDIKQKSGQMEDGRKKGKKEKPGGEKVI